MITGIVKSSSGLSCPSFSVTRAGAISVGATGTFGASVTGAGTVITASWVIITTGFTGNGVGVKTSLGTVATLGVGVESAL